MVKNKQELSQEAKRFVSNAGQDLKAKVTAFLDELEITEDEFAEIIGIPQSEMDKIMNGDINTLHINTFAKLLIATNNAIQIIPVMETPIKEYGNGPLPIVPPFIMPPLPFVKQRNSNEREDEEEAFYRTKSRENLISIIRRNLWDSEINTSTATFDQLVKFLADKDKRLKAFKREKESRRPSQSPQRTHTRNIPVTSEEDNEDAEEKSAKQLEKDIEKTLKKLNKFFSNKNVQQAVKDDRNFIDEFLKGQF